MCLLREKEKSSGRSEIQRKSIQFMHTQRNQSELAELSSFPDVCVYCVRRRRVTDEVRFEEN